MSKKVKSPSRSISYLITVSRAHFLSAQMLLMTLREKTNAGIVVVGNLDGNQAELLQLLGAAYIDEDTIDLTGRLPNVTWQKKHREFGWYKQQIIRLCIDRFMTTDQVVILDSEVFVLDNWDESRFYDQKTGRPRCGYWIPEKRKPDWDYRMYEGAAYLLSFLPECKGIMDYARSDNFKRSITGVGLFSTQNVQKLWQLLQEKTDLAHNLDRLFNHEPELMFAEYVFYALAVEYGLFDDTVPTVLDEGLLGWYEGHDDPVFAAFKASAMWSMCQNYLAYPAPTSYYMYMKKTAAALHGTLPARPIYWNEPDIELIDVQYDAQEGIGYFKKYQRQLDHTFRRRFATMNRALEIVLGAGKKDPTIVEIGTLRDSTKGGGHSTYKFGEFCSRFGGTVHTVDILKEAIDFSKTASKEYQPWIQYHVSDSVDFLEKFDGKIDLLYLDGFDSTPGMEKAASEQQLKEIKTALPKLADGCAGLLDDADLPEGGKAGLSSKFLLDNGFKLEINAYQQLYTRKPAFPITGGTRAKLKRLAKKVIKKTVPILSREVARVRHIEAQLTTVNERIDEINKRLADRELPDSRLDQLRTLVAGVEPYQPAYHVAGIIDTPARSSYDRCTAIEAAIGPLAGKRILDIGSSLGYVSFFMADRGAVVQGWESNAQNAEAARLIQGINGVPVDFRTKELNLETVVTIEPHEYDAAVLLNIAHHIIRFHGLAYTQQLMKELLQRVPVLVAELARKGEDASLPWDASQPDSELAIFDLIKNDISIEKVGDFGNHLTDKTRPLYAIKRRQVVRVGSHEYAFSEQKNVAYKDSPVAYHQVQRRYYFHDDHVVKEYILGKGLPRDTYGQILNEIQLLTNLSEKKIHHLPQLLDFEISQKRIAVVLGRTEGALLGDIGKQLNVSDMKVLLKDILRTLDDLHKLGVNHNDVRPWNVIVSPSRREAWLIDYGLAGPLRQEDDIVSALQLIVEAAEGASARNQRPQKLSDVAHRLPAGWQDMKDFCQKHPQPSAAELIKVLT